jgi:Small-conductance mechanosensitive channel
MRYNLNNLFLACYEDDDAAAKAAADKAAADTAAAEQIKTQEQLNAVLKREKEKFRAADEKRAKQLEEFQASSRLTAEQNAQLTAQIEELRSAHLSTEEKARRDKERLDKEWQGKHEAAATQAKQWQQNYTGLKIGYEISAAAGKHKVLPPNVKFVEAFLGPRTRLVEVEVDGKPSGDFTAMVKFPDSDKDGKSIVVDLSVPDAVKRMKELPEEYGYLFEAPAGGGVGGGSGTPGKKKGVADLSTAEYIEARKKDRKAVLEMGDKK